MPRAKTANEKRGKTRDQESQRERVRARAVEAINAHIRKAGGDAVWTKDSSPAFDDDPASKHAREVYRRLVAALCEACALDGPAGELVDGWTANVRAFLKGLGPKTRSWTSLHPLLKPTHALRGSDDWTPLRRLVRHWRVLGVPWRHGSPAGAWGTPTSDDLALIAIASLRPNALDLDAAEGFDSVRDRTVDRVKKEAKRLDADEKRELEAWARAAEGDSGPR